MSTCRLARSFAVLVPLAAALLVGWSVPILAGIDDNFDWKNNKRTLKIKIENPNATIGGVTVSSIMQTAIANWNNITPSTGWTLQIAGAGETGDVEVSVGTITDSS